MSGKVTGWVVEHGPRDIYEFAALLTIADAANVDGENAHPGMANLVHGSRMAGRRSVERVVKRLIDGGWVEVTERGGGRGRATVYRVLMGRPASGSIPGPGDGGSGESEGTQNPDGETADPPARNPVPKPGPDGRETRSRRTRNPVEKPGPDGRETRSRRTRNPVPTDEKPGPDGRETRSLACATPCTATEVPTGSTNAPPPPNRFAADTEAARGHPARRRTASEVRDEVLRRRQVHPRDRSGIYDLALGYLEVGVPRDELVEDLVNAAALTTRSVDVERHRRKRRGDRPPSSVGSRTLEGASAYLASRGIA